MKICITVAVAAMSLALSAADGQKNAWDGLLDAAVWPDVEPQSYDYRSDPAFKMKGSYFRGRFVSAAADAADGANKARYLVRRLFRIEKKIADAWLQGVGDQRVQFRINAKPVMNSWFDTYSPRKRTETANVAKFLKVGDNVLVGEYTVGSNVFHGVARSFPGGVVADLTVKYEDGSFEIISTDEKCESSTDFHNWGAVVLSDPPPVPPRYARLKYNDYSRPQRLLEGGPDNDKVPGGAKIKFSYLFKGPAPDGEFSLRLLMKKGDWYGPLAWEDEFDLSGSSVAKKENGLWRLEFSIDSPRSASPGSYVYEFESNSIYIPDGCRMKGELEIGRALCEGGFGRPFAATVEKVGGIPEVHIDGRPFPLFWGSIAPGKRPDGKPRHSAMPLNAITVYAPIGAWHPETGKYDFTVFDLVAEKHRRENPEAYFIWDLTVYPRPDFVKDNPGEMVIDEKGERAYSGRTQWSYASRKSMDELKCMIEKAIRYLATSSYANRILGFRICSGVTIEWLGWEAKNGRAVDFSEPNRRAWAEFAAKYYPELENPHVPTYQELVELDAPNDILWDRRHHLNAIAYMDYNSWIIARDALELCAHAKSTLRSLGLERLVGTYYGYTFFLNASGQTQWRGHFALKELLSGCRGKIDFLMSPQSYGQRRLGDTCGEMKPFSSLTAAGIMPIVEDDTRTHNCIGQDWRGYHQTLTPAQTENVLKRNAAIRLCQGSAPYLYALVTGYEYNSPECAAAGRAIFDIRKFCLERKVSRHAEVALVASERSVTAMPSLATLARGATGLWTQEYGHDGRVVRRKETRPLLHGEVFNGAHTKFARSGASVDYLLAEDLDEYSGNYKLYVFLNQMVFDDKLLKAVKAIRSRGAAILWLYAPGYSNANSTADMEKLTGIRFAKCDSSGVAAADMKSPRRVMGMAQSKVESRFYPLDPDEVLGTYADGKPAVARIRTGRSDVYFSAVWQLDMEFIRELMRRAGVHLYSDSLDPMEANDALFTLHARTPGVKTVKLPRKATVVDVFNRRLVARDTEEFSFDAELHSSHLFYYGPDAERFITAE